MKHVQKYLVFESSTEARNPNTSPERLAEIIFEDPPAPLVAMMAAANPNAPIEAIIAASHSEWGAIREGAARNRKTPTFILDKLGLDNNSTVRYTVANNPSTSVETLVRLAQDKNESVRNAALRNPKTPSDITDWAIGGDDSWL